MCPVGGTGGRFQEGIGLVEKRVLDEETSDFSILADLFVTESEESFCYTVDKVVASCNFFGFSL
jgi:hypothetical protein